MTDSSKFATTASVVTLIKLLLQNEKRSYNDNYCNNYICNSYIFLFYCKSVQIEKNIVVRFAS